MVILSAVLSSGSRLRSNGDSNIPAKPCIDARISSSDATRRAHALSARFGLSKREEEIAEHLLEGRSRPYIRDELYISISTVNTHVRHIYEKVGVNSLQDLIDIAKSEDGR
ncbi:response regulator transcription factor [uncultured Slackia sp.]|uniref:response regulator transcription factor n=1 Tax=uncultured Slackia sp. TaxID=665903 RepID=UPI0026DCE076|nr:helix-turn-helix transcriptional regulator [uncultured Slackia sp.]